METSLQYPQNSRYHFIRDKMIVVGWITLFWLLLAFYQYFDRFTIQASNGCVEPNYVHWPIIRGMFVSLILGGMTGGTAMVFLWENWLRKMPFLKALFYIIGWYTLLNLLITFIAVSIYDGPDSPLRGKKFSEAILPAVFDINLLPNFLFWLFIMLLTMAILLIRDKLGSGVFLDYFRGRYFRPRKEERIFMFMDLKSSTTIAEKLGEDKYFNFLNDTFKTATPGILATKGEIYQYVGDEIVVSWRFTDGVKNAQCIRCFYEMTDLLAQRASYFEATYGERPIFKAGLHSGHVIAGEMGIIKREIVYTGDVLNTTARIQAQCNAKNVKILVSNSLFEQIELNSLAIEPINLGELELRGKSEKVEVVTF